MSYILTNVRITVATSDVQSILEIPVADEIHMEARSHGHDLAEQRHIQQTCVSTVAFQSCRYIKLEKHKLIQIAERKIRISLDKLVYSFLDVKLQRFLRKRYEGKYDISSVLDR